MFKRRQYIAQQSKATPLLNRLIAQCLHVRGQDVEVRNVAL